MVQEPQVKNHLEKRSLQRGEHHYNPFHIHNSWSTFLLSLSRKHIAGLENVQKATKTAKGLLWLLHGSV